MTEGRERRIIQVLIMSLVVGAFSFASSFFILFVIGMHFGFVDVFVSARHPNPYWGIVIWVVSVGAFVLSARAFFRYAAKKFVPNRLNPR